MGRWVCSEGFEEPRRNTRGGTDVRTPDPVVDTEPPDVTQGSGGRGDQDSG